jgi:hypothetical protein
MLNDRIRDAGSPDVRRAGGLLADRVAGRAGEAFAITLLQVEGFRGWVPRCDLIAAIGAY